MFYNYLLKCFVLIDLKLNKVTFQDVEQMDMYVKIYDELRRGSDDNPTIGIVLCSETDKNIARYSVLKGNGRYSALFHFLPHQTFVKATYARSIVYLCCG
ncbi:PDDEXK nuclease domain-containing protein [Bacteroides cellulosilyticus]|uniref:PDDEXK nuclease domain-containing protein n=1 Tax=Bacteroides cellulosilyticus TaxID=246787 RepID=UPI00286EC881|nr:PDDEXK nuclease domain-containing protein [Bacteroides cellulosilyticus]